MMTCGTVDLSNLEAIIDMVLTRNEKEFLLVLEQTRGFTGTLAASYCALREGRFSRQRFSLLITAWLMIGIELGLQQAQVKKFHDQN